MAILKAALLGNPVLREKARALSKKEISDPEIQRLSDDMIETMRDYCGVGLAAPQVHRSLRIIVISSIYDTRFPARGPLPTYVIINPEIISHAEDQEEDWEGCLSIPDMKGKVLRWRKIRVGGMDRHGNDVDMEVEDFPARIIQHEMDHLDGLVFLDRMKDLSTLTYISELEKLNRMRLLNPGE